MKFSGSRTYLRQTPVPKMPPGLVELMEGLTKEVLRKNPTDIYKFCAAHMEELVKIRDGFVQKEVMSSKKMKTKIHKKQEMGNEKCSNTCDENVILNNYVLNHLIPGEGVKKDMTVLTENNLKIPVIQEVDLIKGSEIEIGKKYTNVENIGENKTVGDSNLSSFVDERIEKTEIQKFDVSDCLGLENQYPIDVSEIDPSRATNLVELSFNTELIHNSNTDKEETIGTLEEKFDQITSDNFDHMNTVDKQENIQASLSNEINSLKIDEPKPVEEILQEQKCAPAYTDNDNMMENLSASIKITSNEMLVHLNKDDLISVNEKIKTVTIDDSEMSVDDVQKAEQIQVIPVFDVNIQEKYNEAIVTNENEGFKSDNLSILEKKDYSIRSIHQDTDSFSEIKEKLNEGNSSNIDDMTEDNIITLKENNKRNYSAESPLKVDIESNDVDYSNINLTDDNSVSDVNTNMLKNVTDLKDNYLEKTNRNLYLEDEVISENDNYDLLAEPTVKSTDQLINLIDVIEQPVNEMSPEYDVALEKPESLNISDKEVQQNIDESNNMDLESAAITIQKVFRSFLFKSRGSTFEDTVNSENNSNDEETDLYKERRPLGITRIDSVLQTVNEEKSLSLSTDDSSTISSAATIIQAHVRGFLVRNRINSRKNLSINSSKKSDSPPATLSDDEEYQQKNKTILNIHIVPEGEIRTFSRDESLITSMDLSLDLSPPTSVNLHPLGYNKSEPRKQLKREDAFQSISPPSNNSGKHSEDIESVKELIINDNILEKSLQENVQANNTLPEVETNVTLEAGPSNTQISSDESDVVTPFADIDNTSKLIHSGEFHDVVLPTKVTRSDTSVVRGE